MNFLYISVTFQIFYYKYIALPIVIINEDNTKSRSSPVARRSSPNHTHKRDHRAKEDNIMLYDIIPPILYMNGHKVYDNFMTMFCSVLIINRSFRIMCVFILRLNGPNPSVGFQWVSG